MFAPPPRFLQSILTSSILVFAFFFTENIHAQNFSYVKGATGTSTGNGVTIDQYGNSYIVGSIENGGLNPGFAFPDSNHFNPAGLPDPTIAYLAKGNVATGVISASAGIASYDGSGTGCPETMGESAVFLKRVVVDRSQNIFVIGLAVGCGLNMYDAAGVLTLSVINDIYCHHERVFVAKYDNTLTPISCHTFSSYGAGLANPSIVGDINVTPMATGNKLHVAFSFKADSIKAQAYGSATGPNPTYETLIQTDSTYDIYLGQIDIATDSLERVLKFGESGNQYVTQLASGYLGYHANAQHLFMSGGFEDTILFTPTSGGTDTLVSAGDYDLFSVRFKDFDLDSQDAVTAGGPWRDFAMALSDDGAIVGGYISDSCSFPGFGDITDLGISTWSEYVDGNRLETGFIATPDYDNGEWYWEKTLKDSLAWGHPPRPSQVNEIASANCNSFYVGWHRGMHPDVTSVGFFNFNDDHLLGLSASPVFPSDTTHSIYSTLSKWNYTGDSGQFVWNHDFYNAFDMTSVGNNGKVRMRYIKDIEIADPSIYDSSVDLVMTGKFGDTILVDTALSGPDSFNGNWSGTSYTHGTSGMFYIGMNEIPEFIPDTHIICVDDTFQIPIHWVLDTSIGANYDFANMTISFQGSGVIDTTNGIFVPLNKQSQTHIIYATIYYYGCSYQDTVAIIKTDRIEFPLQTIHPSSTDESQGLAVEMVNKSQSGLGQHLYLLAGKFKGVIELEQYHYDKTNFRDTATNWAGYIVAYDRCGVKWANTFEGSSGTSFVEGIDINQDDKKVYITGNMSEAQTIKNSNGHAPPLTPTNSAINLDTGAFDKGFVAQLNAINGKVNWIYLGSTVITDSNTFHDIKFEDSLLFVTGEFHSVFTEGSSFTLAPYTWPSSINSAMVLVLDENGTARHGASFGAKFSGATNHGDALDVMYESNKAGYFIYNTGHIDSLNGNFYGFNGNIGCDTTQAISAYLAVLRYDLNTSMVIADSIRIYDGPISTGKDVIVTELGDTGPRYPHQVVFCGEFLDTINASGVCDSTWGISSAGGQDGFIACTDYTLNTMWFYNEGSSSPVDESAEALDYKGTNKVYATGTFKGIPTTHYLSAYNPGSSSNGVNAGGGGNNGVFVVHFELDGDSVTAFDASPTATGMNQGTDLFVANNTVFLSGRFISSPLSFDHSSLYNSVGGEDSFIARFRVQTDTFYKKDKDEYEALEFDQVISVYPNPNAGGFNIVFQEEVTGSLQLFSISGQLVFDRLISNSSLVELNLKLPDGLYYLVFMHQNRQYQTPIIIQN